MSERNVPWARANAKFMRDCASAIAVGGPTVAVTLIVGSLAIHRQAFVALLVLEALLLLGAVYFERRAYLAVGVTPHISYWLKVVFISIVLLFYAVDTAVSSSKSFPAMPYGSSWWSLVAVSFGAGITGAIFRRIADRFLDELEDQRLDALAPTQDNRLYWQRRRRNGGADQS